MATISGENHGRAVQTTTRQSWNTFSEAERRQMLKDDIQAGASVALVLTGVILVGLIIGAVGVTLSIW